MSMCLACRCGHHDDPHGAPLVPAGAFRDRDPGKRAASAVADPGVGPDVGFEPPKVARWVYALALGSADRR